MRNFAHPRRLGGVRGRRTAEARRSTVPPGWRTTDGEEIERRRPRAAEESPEVEALEPGRPRFGSFRAGASGGRSYLVEIRSLDGFDNSCDCPDFQINGLGFCKHVAAVLERVRRVPSRQAGGWATIRARTSERVEVFLRRSISPPQVRISWPGRGAAAGRALVAPFASATGSLIGDPLSVLPQLARRLERAPARTRRQVRLSRPSFLRAHLVAIASAVRRSYRDCSGK